MRSFRSWCALAPAFALVGCLGSSAVEAGAGAVESAELDAAVGSIEIRGVLRCSAVAIDERHVATAAYCLPAAHLSDPGLLGRSEMFFVTGASADDPASRRVPIIAHEVLRAGIPGPLDADLGIGLLAEAIPGPFVPLAPAAAEWPEWTTTMRVVSMGAPTATAPFGARRVRELEVGATNGELIDLYRPDGAFCMVDMGGALIATIDDRPVLAGVLGHWATRGGEPAANGDWCSPAGGQAIATRTEEGAFLAAASARLDEQMMFAFEIFEPGNQGRWMLYESAALDRGTAHGVGLTMPPGATSIVVDLVGRPGDPFPQLAVGRGRMPRIGQPAECEPIGQSCSGGDADACARYDRECVTPTFVDADWLPEPTHHSVLEADVREPGEYFGINFGNLSGDLPATYAVAVWVKFAPPLEP